MRGAARGRQQFARVLRQPGKAAATPAATPGATLGRLARTTRHVARIIAHDIDFFIELSAAQAVGNCRAGQRVGGVQRRNPGVQIRAAARRSPCGAYEPTRIGPWISKGVPIPTASPASEGAVIRRQFGNHPVQPARGDAGIIGADLQEILRLEMAAGCGTGRPPRARAEPRRPDTWHKRPAVPGSSRRRNRQGHASRRAGQVPAGSGPGRRLARLASPYGTTEGHTVQRAAEQHHHEALVGRRIGQRQF